MVNFGRWRDFQERKEKEQPKESFDRHEFRERLQHFWQFHRYFFASTNDIIVEIKKKIGLLYSTFGITYCFG